MMSEWVEWIASTLAVAVAVEDAGEGTPFDRCRFVEFEAAAASRRAALRF
jgi:hypothetical protein